MPAAEQRVHLTATKHQTPNTTLVQRFMLRPTRPDETGRNSSVPVPERIGNQEQNRSHASDCVHCLQVCAGDPVPSSGRLLPGRSRRLVRRRRHLRAGAAASGGHGERVLGRLMRHRRHLVAAAAGPPRVVRARTPLRAHCLRLSCCCQPCEDGMVRQQLACPAATLPLLVL